MDCHVTCGGRGGNWLRTTFIPTGGNFARSSSVTRPHSKLGGGRSVHGGALTLISVPTFVTPFQARDLNERRKKRNS